jgi:hypothetical protein
MLSVGLSGSAVAAALNVTRASLRYRMRRFKLQSNITDGELDRHVRLRVSENPIAGERFILARLRVSGIIVSRQRVRNSIHRVDTGGSERRRCRRLRRRTYFVPHTNYLWHADGWHKLIR